MKIYSVLKMGEYHTNHCEDHLYYGEIGNDKIICAIMDGCTMSIESYFASTLIGKILRKVSKEKGYKELLGHEQHIQTIEEHLKDMLFEMFKDLKLIKNQLMLDIKELLTTLIILVYDKKQNEGIVLIIGDGLVSINGKIKEYDQDNKPDYLGFHLNKDFDAWYSTQNQKIFFTNLYDVSIATDGIFTFENINLVKTEETINVIDFLVNDKSNSNREEMLNIKIKKLENGFGLKPTDDFSMIRIMSNFSDSAE